MNLMDACPPFQIDGNFGYTSGLAEMLLQSHAGFVQLLPALPFVWPDGNVTGLMARSGFKIDMQWKSGKIVGGVITSTRGGNCRLRTSVAVKIIGVTSSVAAGENPNLCSGLSIPERLRSPQVRLLEKLKRQNITPLISKLRKKEL